MRQHTLAVLALLTATGGALSLSGCFGLACDQMAVASVVVNVVDETGQPLAPDSVSFTVDGGAPEAAECWFEEPCTSFVTGWERAGTFDVTATLCGQDVTGSVTVGSTADQCHVEGQELELVIDRSQCETATLDIHYSFDGYFGGGTDCAAAWTNTLYLRAERDGFDPVTGSFPCTDTQLTVSDLPLGEWTVQLANVEDPGTAGGPFAASPLTSVVVPDDSPVSLVLTCDENGVDDGCGGAR